jgi:hypothetical protein
MPVDVANAYPGIWIDIGQHAPKAAIDLMLWVHNREGVLATPPEFPGWEAVRRDVPWEEGMVYCNPFGHGGVNPNTPDTATPVPSYAYGRRSMDLMAIGDGYAVYRRVGARGPRKLPGNRHFATPSPLP